MVADCCQSMGIDIKNTGLHRERLEAAGFEDIVEVTQRLPINAWPKEQQQAELGTVEEFHTCSQILIRYDRQKYTGKSGIVDIKPQSRTLHKSKAMVEGTD
jgi:hypothetical protein